MDYLHKVSNVVDMCISWCHHVILIYLRRKSVQTNQEFPKSKLISLKFVPKGLLTTSQHWFRLWLGAEQATSHDLNQCWTSSLTHICGTRGRWVKERKKHQAMKSFPNLSWYMHRQISVTQHLPTHKWEYVFMAPIHYLKLCKLIAYLDFLLEIW